MTVNLRTLKCCEEFYLQAATKPRCRVASNTVDLRFKREDLFDEQVAIVEALFRLADYGLHNALRCRHSHGNMRHCRV